MPPNFLEDFVRPQGKNRFQRALLGAGTSVFESAWGVQTMAPFVRRGHLAVRWTARIFAAVLLALVAAIAIGQGIPNFLEVTAVEGILFLAFAIMLVGLLMGFRWEIQGGVLILMGLSVFYAMNFAASGKLPGGAFPLFFVPGTLYLLSGLLGRKDRGAQPLAG